MELDKAKETLLATKAKGPDGMASLLSKAQSKRMTSDAEANTLVVLAPEASGSDSDLEMCEIMDTTLSLPPRYVELAKLLRHPPPLEADWCPVVAAGKFLPKKDSADIAKLQKELANNQSLASLQEQKVVPATAAEAAATKKKIEFLTKKISEADADSAKALATAELDVASKNYAKFEAAKVVRSEAGAMKAEERADSLESICMAQMTAWETHLDDLRTQRTARNGAWLARRLELEGRVHQVEEYLDSRLQEAQDRSADLPMNSGQKMLNVNLPLQDAKAEVVQLRSENQTLLERLEALELKMTTTAPPPTPAATTTRLSDAVHIQCSQTILHGEHDIPVLKAAPNKDCKRRLALLAANLSAWGQSGQCPLTYGSLLAGTEKDDLPASLQNIKDVAGTVIWTRFYADVEVDMETYVPFQLGAIMCTSLTRAESTLAKYQKEFDYAQEARERFAELQEGDIKAKKSRSGPYGQ